MYHNYYNKNIYEMYYYSYNNCKINNNNVD